MNVLPLHFFEENVGFLSNQIPISEVIKILRTDIHRNRNRRVSVTFFLVCILKRETLEMDSGFCMKILLREFMDDYLRNFRFVLRLVKVASSNCRRMDMKKELLIGEDGSASLKLSQRLRVYRRFIDEHRKRET